MEEFNKDYGTFIYDFEKAEVCFLNSLLFCWYFCWHFW